MTWTVLSNVFLDELADFRRQIGPSEGEGDLRFQEAGLVAAVEAGALVAQAVERLVALQPGWRTSPRSELAKLSPNPLIVERLAKIGIEPLALAPQQFEKLLAEDLERVEKIVKISGAKAE